MPRQRTKKYENKEQRSPFTLTISESVIYRIAKKAAANNRPLSKEVELALILYSKP
jgi:hypothetical protein